VDFDARVAPYVRGRLWHDSQHIDALPDGGVRVTLNVSNDWALRSWLLGFGAAVKVRRPGALADALLDEHKRAAAKYEPPLDLDPAADPDPGPPLPL
jgi:predicted DNA-binding transcriptional regulator YafY